MAKLTEKQINILAIVGGVLAVILFSVLSYFDYEEIEVIKQQQEAVQGEINQARAKKNQLVVLKSQLYILKENYEFVKQMLPDDREILKFYETLDQFRLSKQMQPWTSFQVKGVDKQDKDRKKEQQALPQMLLTTEYGADIPATLNQLGELLTAIENYPRFYGVTRINIPTMDSPDGLEKPVNISLDLISFTYPKKTGFDEQRLKTLMSDFKVTTKENKALQELKEKWQRVSFQWSPVPRNPFDKYKVLIKEKEQEKAGPNKAEVINPAPVVTNIQKEIGDLEKLRNQHLIPFAVAGLWAELKNKMGEHNYEARLTGLVLPADTDAGLVKKVQEMNQELRNWKVEIQKLGLEEEARQFISVAEKKTQEMQELYQEAKDKADVAMFEKIIKLYNDLLPQQRKYEPLENKITQLQSLRKKAEELYTKADTQIKIIQEVSKLELQGIIYWANKPQYSVAFINKKVVRKDDVVMTSFTVDDIREGEVILRYKEETVPVRLKRVIKASSFIKKSS